MASVAGIEPTASRGLSATSRSGGGWIRRSSAAPEPGGSLAKLVEGEIIPRLMVAHGFAFASANCAEVAIEPAEIAAFAPLALEIEADALLDHVEGLLRRGVTIETLFVDLIAPAARHLGVLWEEDRCDFVDVTMGLWRLQEMVRELAARLPVERSLAAGEGRSALFAAMPGDQHSFGTVMIGEMFRREGWHSEVILDPGMPELLERIAGDSFDIVGLTVSGDCHIGRLPAIIRALRNVSRNPRLVVMVGGRVFINDPSLAAHVGADGTAADARMAVARAAELVGARIGEVAGA